MSAQERVIPSVRDALIASAKREAKGHRADGRTHVAELLEAMADHMSAPPLAAEVHAARGVLGDLSAWVGEADRVLGALDVDAARDALEKLCWRAECAADRIERERFTPDALELGKLLRDAIAKVEPLRQPEQLAGPDHRWLHYVGHLDAVLTHLHSLEIAIKVGTNGPIRDAYERLAGRFEKLRDYGTALVKDRHHCHDETCRAFDGPACALCGDEDLFCVYTEGNQQVCEDCVSEELYLSTRYGRDVAVYELTCEMQEKLERQLRDSTVGEIHDTLKSWTGVMDKINPEMADRLTRLSGLSMVFEAMLDDVTRIELEDPSGGTYAREQEPDPSIEPEQIEAMRRMRASLPRGGFSKDPHAEPTEEQRALRAKHRAKLTAQRAREEEGREERERQHRADIATAQQKYSGLTWKSDAQVFAAGADEAEIQKAMGRGPIPDPTEG